MGTTPDDAAARPFTQLSGYRIAGTVWAVGVALVAAAALTSTRSARAVPAFAQQTGQPCKSCHVGGFGPELTPFGREFKLGGYTLRAHASVPVAAMAVTSITHTRRDQEPAPEHLNRNDNLVLDEAALFVAGGVGKHFGGFAEITYEGVDRHAAWDNLDLRAVTTGKLFGSDATFGLSLNNNPTIQDAWNTLPAWGFPFTDTNVSGTPAAAPLIDDSLAQNVLGLAGYVWIDHRFYLEVGGYSSPSRGTLRFLGADPADPGSIRGAAPYGRIAYQAKVAGGTLEVGASALRTALFPGRDQSSGFADHYTDLGLDASWQNTIGASDTLSANFRYEHERASLRASCALGLLGTGDDPGCARYRLNELRAAVRYTWHDRLGVTISPFSIAGTRNFAAFENGSPNSNGVMGQVDYTLWPDSSSPFGPRFNARVGVQYTAYGKFDGRRSNASDNDALRLFTWIAF
ncbi:MAG: hypothetical protein ACJ8FS_08620 [Sphingomicrobium sp.]